MAKEYWTLEEVMEIFHMEEGILRDLEEEEIICPLCQQGLLKRSFRSAKWKSSALPSSLWTRWR